MSSFSFRDIVSSFAINSLSPHSIVVATTRGLKELHLDEEGIDMLLFLLSSRHLFFLVFLFAPLVLSLFFFFFVLSSSPPPLLLFLLVPFTLLLLCRFFPSTPPPLLIFVFHSFRETAKLLGTVPSPSVIQSAPVSTSSSAPHDLRSSSSSLHLSTSVTASPLLSNQHSLPMAISPVRGAKKNSSGAAVTVQSLRAHPKEPFCTSPSFLFRSLSFFLLFIPLIPHVFQTFQAVPMETF